MADNLTVVQRVRSMRGNRSTGTSPETAVRRLLRKGKLRYRSQWKGIPGTPDFVLPGPKVALFVHGCFWHAHVCQTQKPATNVPYWTEKLRRNVARDRRVRGLVRKAGWQPITIWECQLKRMTAERLVAKITRKAEKK